jgi:stage V sporulation protein SpoVS
MDLDTLTPQELDALENGIRKLREDEARQRAEAQRQRSGPVCRAEHVFVRTRRNGQNSMPSRCDDVAEAIGIARKYVTDHGFTLFLVDADEDFEQKSVERGDGVFIVEEVSEFWGPTVRRPAPWGLLRNRPPLCEYFAAREASRAKK